jgi:hypothetical protein
MAETATAPTALYPCRDEVFYGRGVWVLGEDGEWGVMVEGHGRRALAALLAQQRDVQGRYYFRPAEVRDAKPVEKWVRFIEDCGCTEAEHAAHVAEANEDGPDCDNTCSHFGLPPCRSDLYTWAWEDVQPDAAAALPVLEVQW